MCKVGLFIGWLADAYVADNDYIASFKFENEFGEQIGHESIGAAVTKLVDLPYRYLKVVDRGRITLLRAEAIQLEKPAYAVGVSIIPWSTKAKKTDVSDKLMSFAFVSAENERNQAFILKVEQ